jgi:hypothetical protein
MSGRLAGTGSPQLQAAWNDHASRGLNIVAPHEKLSAMHNIDMMWVFIGCAQGQGQFP